MRFSLLCLFLGLFLFIGNGCFFSPNVSDGFYVCQLQGDCPKGMTCSLVLHRCIKKQTVVKKCSPEGSTTSCYSGAGSPLGNCKAGTKTCRSGSWSSCAGEILPSKEVCDGKDNNCDGQIDENCSCQEGDKRQCYPGPSGTRNRGACRAGSQICRNLRWSGCVGFVIPLLEKCNGRDDNCNGQVDEQLTRRCYTGPPPSLGRGVCRSGKQTCSSGRWGTCSGQVQPKNEVCNNGQDDNCNGQIDENCSACTTGLTQACYGGPRNTKNVGSCRAGRQICDGAGKWGRCVGQILPKQEICDNQDNDCNGKIDDSISIRSCYTGPPVTRNRGACHDGRQQCLSGAWSACIGEVSPKPEMCDGIDNNCNGTTDEGCECTPNTTRSCYSGPAQTKGVGRCRSGIQRCSASRKWGKCLKEVLPSKEACNNIDDDCDGNIDGFSERCYTGKVGTAGRGSCRFGARTCRAGKWSGCLGEVKPAVEICDGKDNDCDGKVDETLQRACFSGIKGCKRVGGNRYACSGRCRIGKETCSGGKWGRCTGEVLPSKETCNNIDDDCDGVIDGYKEACYTQPDKGCTPDGKGRFRCKGSCKTGVRRCQSGSLSICVGQVSKQSEVCDGKDNNCDGQIDEGCQCISKRVRSCYAPSTGCVKSGTSYKCKGLCKSGKQTCDAFGQWGKCIGEKGPAKEICNGKDDDCDGKIDGMTQRCYSGAAQTRGRAPCRDGLNTCNNGKWSACSGQVLPKKEICNGIDDDCNGKVDDHLVAPKCPKQKGVCLGAVQKCGGKKGWLACSIADYGPLYQLLETKCDGKDNDCNGKVDGVGACGKCILSTKPPIFTNKLPTTCKATDKCYDHCMWYKKTLYYCRKTKSNSFSYSTYTTWLTGCNSKSTCQVSACGGRNFFCDGTRWREGRKPGKNDDFCDGLDNNCNGKIDEDCTCQSPCTADRYCKGPCKRCVQQVGSPFPTCAP